MKAIKIILLTALLFIAFGDAAQAAELKNSIMPEVDEKQIGNVELQYNKYPVSRYSMDTKAPENELNDLWQWGEASTKALWQVLMMVNSLIWNFITFIGMWTGQFVEFAFTLDVVDNVIEEIAAGIQTISGIGPNGYLSDGIFQMLGLYFFAAAIGWFAWYAIFKKATSHAVSGLIRVIIVVLCFYGYSYYAEPILKGMNDLSNGISQNVLAMASKVTDPGNDYTPEEGYANMRNAIFNTMTYQPYLLVQWGTTDEKEIENEYKKDGSRIHDLLKTEDYTKERIKQVEYEVEEQKNKNMQPEALIDRFGFLILLAIANGVMSAVLVLVSGGAILFQFMVLITALIGVFALLVSIFPDYAGNALTWFAKLSHWFLMKIAFCLLLTFIFMIQTIFYNAMADDNSYVATMLMYLVVTVGVVWKRNEILAFIVRPTRRSGIAPGTGSTAGEYKSAIGKGKMYFNKITKPFTKPATPEHKTAYYKIKNNPGVGAAYRNHRAYQDNSRHKNYGAIKRDAPAPIENKTSDRTKTTNQNNNVNKTSQQPVNKTASRVDQQPPTLSKEDLNSLDRTTQKGGWGYQATEKPDAAAKSQGDFRGIKPENKEIKNNTVNRTGGQKNASSDQ